MRAWVLFAFFVTLIGCHHEPRSKPNSAQTWFNLLATQCGKTLTGRITRNEGANANDPFVGKRIEVEVKDCSDSQIRLPLRVGNDSSRTWIITKLPNTIRLKHEHRHADGTLDPLTNYGGQGTAKRGVVDFPADAESIALFETQNLLPSTQNVWRIEVSQAGLAYQLSRPNRVFRLEFDAPSMN
jgi:hypothetical protein